MYGKWTNRFTCWYCRGLGEGGRSGWGEGVYGKWADKFTCWYSRGLREGGRSGWEGGGGVWEMGG